jgi:hypothetical protein
MKICTKCNVMKDEDQFFRRSDTGKSMAWCKDCRNTHRGTTRHKYRSSTLLAKKRWYAKHADKINNHKKSKRAANKSIVYSHYGEACAICSESINEFLTIDHVSGGGRQHRRQISSRIYEWLILNRFPSEFRILCRNCNVKVFIDQNQRQIINRHKKYRELTKIKVLNRYGIQCKCCGISNKSILNIDHIYNNGSKHRRLIGSSHKFYMWLVKNNYPDGYQTLCFNCNYGKYINSVCPHQAHL